MNSFRFCRGLALVAALSFIPTLVQAQLVRSATGVNTAAVQATVDTFRTDLGALNPNVPGSFGSGRREINWDGVPDASSAPNNLAANFFNVNSPRGVIFSTAGTGFQTSSTAASGTPVEFGNINPSYTGTFATFSPQRLFTSLGSNVMTVNFFIPGSNTPALTRGFGAVFTDVDLANTTSIQLFNAASVSLGTFFVPATLGSETFSFLGISFPTAVVASVRITLGNIALGAGVTEGVIDVAVLDDFIYGEPVPEPSTVMFLLAGGTLAMLLRKRRAATRG